MSELVKRLRKPSSAIHKVTQNGVEWTVSTDIDAERAEAAAAIEAQAKRIEHLEMQLRMAVNSDSEYCKTVEADNAHLKICIAELEAAKVKLREALVKLNSAVDAFWNDPDRPSIAKMKSNSVYNVNKAQHHARAALGENNGDN